MTRTQTRLFAIFVGARVLVVDGPSSGAAATTDASGRYSIANLSAAGFTVRASLDGYTDVSRGVALNADTTLDFELPKIRVTARSTEREHGPQDQAFGQTTRAATSPNPLRTEEDG